MAQIQPLVKIEGVFVEIDGQDRTHITATCREHGDLDHVAMPQSLHQAGLVQRRHLAEHLTALAQEIQEAAR